MKTVKEAVTTTCKVALGPQKENHKPWISAESLKRVDKRKEKKSTLNSSRTKAEKMKAQTQYREANK